MLYVRFQHFNIVNVGPFHLRMTLLYGIVIFRHPKVVQGDGLRVATSFIRQIWVCRVILEIVHSLSKRVLYKGKIIRVSGLQQLLCWHFTITAESYVPVGNKVIRAYCLSGDHTGTPYTSNKK